MTDQDSSTTHTRGPWEVVPGDWSDDWGVTERGVAGQSIAQMVWENDARLIAAAPDLLQACKIALNDRMYKDWPDVADILMDAIKKAEGRTD